jgi:hypothetical protein
MIDDLHYTWADEHWQAEVERWIHEQLALLGLKPTSPIVAVSQWALSCVLRIPTDQENVFFKAAKLLPGNTNEAVLLPALARLFPEDVPNPLAVEPARHWILLPDIGQDMRSAHITDESSWQAVIQRFAMLQIQAVGRLEEVLPVQDMTVLATQIETLVADERALSALQEVERIRLRQRVDGWLHDCDRLAKQAIPMTMVHGDLHGGNIAFQEGGAFHYFDWTETCISHPFFDLFVFLNDANNQGVTAAAQDRLRDAYLSQWTNYESIEHLRAMYPLTAPLAALHQALIYNRIADVLAPTPDARRRRVGEWLRKCL